MLWNRTILPEIIDATERIDTNGFHNTIILKLMALISPQNTQLTIRKKNDKEIKDFRSIHLYFVVPGSRIIFKR